MKIQKIITLSILFLFFSINSNAQNAKYVGSWTMVKSPIKDKCAKLQHIELRKDGTATYTYGKDGDGCKLKKQEFKTWSVENKEFKRRTGVIKKTVLVIGRNDNIIFYIDKKKSKLMEVTTDLVSGDTTKKAIIAFEKS